MRKLSRLLIKGQRYDGFRVSIVGGCQVAGLGAWIERFLPGSRVDPWHVGVSIDNSIEAILDALPGSDLIITQVIDGHDGGRLDASVLRGYAEHLVFLPTFVFAGFHPDFVFREYDETKYLASPVGLMHSALVIASFQHGVPEHHVAKLFNPIVYDAAGYFDVYEDGRFAMIKIFKESGYDISEAFDEWTLGGPFMHTDNHPHIRVLGKLAQLALEKAGLLGVACTGEPSDVLGEYSLHWPIHRPIARRLGVAPFSKFRRSLLDMKPGNTREISLDEFISGCYSIYAKNTDLDFSTHIRIRRAQVALESLLSPK